MRPNGPARPFHEPYTELTHTHTHPHTHTPTHPGVQEYVVLANRAPSRAQVQRMMEGVEIDGTLVAPEEIRCGRMHSSLCIVGREGFI